MLILQVHIVYDQDVKIETLSGNANDQAFPSFQMLYIKNITNVAHQHYSFLSQQPFLTFQKVQYGFERVEQSKHQ